MRDYVCFQLLGKKVFAIQEPGRKRCKAAVNCIQPFTFRRKVVKSIFSLLCSLGIQNLFSKSIDLFSDQPSFNFGAWVDGLRIKLQLDGDSQVLMWPSQVERKRTYVYILDSHLSPIAFAKIDNSVDGKEKIERERNALCSFDMKSSFKVPKILDFELNEVYCSLVTELIPSSAKPLSSSELGDFSNLIPRLTGSAESVSTSTLGALSWWDDFENKVNSDVSGFLAELKKSIHGEVFVAKAHGDLSPANILQDGKELWVFDWEESRVDAPRMTDVVGFYLSVRMRKTLKNPSLAVLEFKKHFLTDVSEQHKADAMLALAFRHASGMPDATVIIENWQNESNEYG